MASRIDELARRIAELERELEDELNQARHNWRFRVEAGRVKFERDVRQAHRRLKQSIPAFFREAELRNLATAPVIYSLIVPFALLDLWVSLYQAICFRAYRIALVPRRRYIVIDRQHLAYLNGIEKLNCIFCGYANGVIAFVREVAGRTEQYWCPIRHARRVRSPHPHYREFVDYGDAAGYHKRLPVLRNELKPEDRPGRT
jgi:vacuolar-type H+-ATPase subunit H